MTRDEVVENLHRFALSHSCDAECLDELQQLDKHDDEQREEIRLLSEQVNVANQELLRRPVDQGKDLAQLQHAYQLLAEAHEKQSKEITRLRKVLSDLSHEVAGALYMRKHEMRNVIGNTNFACLEQRMREAEQALTQEST